MRRVRNRSGLLYRQEDGLQRCPAVAGVGSGANEMRHAGLTIPEDSVLALQSAVQEAMRDGRLQLPRHL